MRKTTFTVQVRESAEPMKRAVVSSIRIQEEKEHDRVSIWNRGALAGELMVNPGDGFRFATRLLAGEPVSATMEQGE